MKLKTILDVGAGECRWPIGDPRDADFHFCGARQLPGRPYCTKHWPLAFIPASQRKRPGAAPLPFIVRKAA
jgi:GcrA cell cycle regulator